MLGHPADFRVKYRFRTLDEGGRKSGEPFQGYRSDFSYTDEANDKLYRIWPEFEDEKGKVLTKHSHRVRNQGTARMWVILPEMRPHHIQKLKIGTKGHFNEGARRVADCEVIEILGLYKNPKKAIEK